MAAVKAFGVRFEAILGEVEKVMVELRPVIQDVLIAMLAEGNVLLEGVPGIGKTYLIKTLGTVLDLKFRRVQFTADLMPSDIIGTSLLVQDAHGKRLAFQPGPHLYQSAPGRRNQPGDAQDAGGPHGGDGGALRQRRRRDQSAGGAVLYPGDAEPHRAGWHLSAAQGPVGQVPLQAAGGLSVAGGPGGGGDADDVWPVSAGQSGGQREADHRDAASWCGRCRWRRTWRIWRCGWCGRRSPTAPHATPTQPQVSGERGGAARIAGDSAFGQGQGAVAGEFLCVGRRRAGGGGAGAAASHRAQPAGPVGGRRPRRDSGSRSSTKSRKGRRNETLRIQDEF